MPFENSRWFNESIPERIIELVKPSGFEPIMRKNDNCLIRFERDGTVIDVWWSRMTVGVYPDGENYDLYLYEVSEDDLFELFMSPLSFKYSGLQKKIKKNFKYKK